ncbi:hypothetical protein BRD03_09120 [Halobacteriales archaeon QS_9_68_17]|nr:MAG: hypothetical protein BRD03_09120 [Halobacteriales archaeon QS_9_68_17]
MEQLIGSVYAATVGLASVTASVTTSGILVAAVLIIGGIGGRLTVQRDDLPLPEQVDRWPITAVGGAAVLVGSLVVVAGTFSAVSGATGAFGTVLVLLGFEAIAVRIAVVEERVLSGVGYGLIGLGFAGLLAGIAPTAGIAAVVVGTGLYFWDDASRPSVGD